MVQFDLIKQFLGYQSKKDETNADPRFMVPGSQNVIINDAEKVSARAGYSIYGATNSALTPIQSSYEWRTSTGTELSLRKYNTTLEYSYNGGAYAAFPNVFVSTANLNFTEWWSATEVKDLLLFVDGTADIYMWSGAVTTFASATTNTITKQGTSTWAEDRFLIAGTRKVVIEGVEYTYTGGEGTTTLTGVTPDPTGGGHTAGDAVIQAIRVTEDKPAAAFKNDLIMSLNNHVYFGSLTRRDLYVSKNTDYADYAFTSPVRKPGEGALLTLDSNPVGFGVQENVIYVSSSANDWYQIVMTLSADLTDESIAVERLKTGARQGAISQSAIGQIKNEIIFFGNDRTIGKIGNVENVNTPQTKPLSDAIKSDLLSYDLTIAPHVKFFQNKVYVTIPSESIVLIYDYEKQFWQPPQVLPVRRLAEIDGELYGHSNAVPETYKLFDGTSDNGNPINAVAKFAYRNYGYRAWQKNFDEWYTEGYLSSNTLLNLSLEYDFNGYTSTVEKTIRGDDDTILFGAAVDASIGKNPLGSQPLGGQTEEVSVLSKFRLKNELKKQDFYEVGVSYESNEIDNQWELLAFGGNIKTSSIDDTSIKQ